MAFIAAADAPSFDFNGVNFTGLAAPSRGSAENAVWRVKLPAGTLSEGPHQLSREEILVAISGEAVARLGDERHVFRVGDAIIVPPFVDFALDNPGDIPFEAVTILPIGGRAMLPGHAPFTPPWAV